MNNLDDPEIYKSLDPGDLFRHLIELPRQCKGVWQKALEFPLPDSFSRVTKVVISGMGGSAIGGDLVQSLSDLEGKRVDVCRDYSVHLPLDDTTLFVACSYSGMTEETISALKGVLDTPAQKLALTSGGTLLEVAQASEVPVFPIEYHAPPRAAIVYSFFALLGLLQQIGFLRDKSSSITETQAVLSKLYHDFKQETPLSRNPAKQLAVKLAGHIAVIYSAGLLSSVARRWKTQINENSKAWSFYELLPELNHNSVLGYQFPAGLSSKMFVILLRSSYLHPRVLARYQITRELLEEVGVEHQSVEPEGASHLSQIMSLLYLGDYVSYFLALLNNTDPLPTGAIDHLKNRMKQL